MEKEARAAGDRELAGQIKGLRKPSVIAAELNMVARAGQDAVEALLQAVVELGEGQQRMAAGEEIDFASLQSSYRSAVESLVELADGQRQPEVRSAIEAIAVESSLHQRLRSGTFVEAPQQIGSFGMAMPESGSIVRPKRTTKKRTTRKRTTRERTTNTPQPAAPVADLRLIRAAKKDLEEATERSVAVAASLHEAESALSSADERAAALETELAAAEAERQRAEESVAAAKREVARSAAEVAKAKEALERATSS